MPALIFYSSIANAGVGISTVTPITWEHIAGVGFNITSDTIQTVYSINFTDGAASLSGTLLTLPDYTFAEVRSRFLKSYRRGRKGFERAVSETSPGFGWVESNGEWIKITNYVSAG